MRSDRTAARKWTVGGAEGRTEGGLVARRRESVAADLLRVQVRPRARVSGVRAVRAVRSTGSVARVSRRRVRVVLPGVRAGARGGVSRRAQSTD